MVDIGCLKTLAKVMTQAEAAREVGISRQRVKQLAEQHGIEFFRHTAEPVVKCNKCSRRKLNGKCLSCFWTKQRIIKLRTRLGMDQVRFSLHAGFGASTVARWEGAETLSLSNASLQKLEVAKDGK